LVSEGVWGIPFSISDNCECDISDICADVGDLLDVLVIIFDVGGLPEKGGV
jgi:hypothetical protein